MVFTRSKQSQRSQVYKTHENSDSEEISDESDTISVYCSSNDSNQSEMSEIDHSHHDSLFDTDDDGYSIDSSIIHSGKMFDEYEKALLEHDWTETTFHDMIVKEFLPIDDNWVKFIKDSVRSYDTPEYRPYIHEVCSVTTLPDHQVGMCRLCNKMKTLSKSIILNGGVEVIWAGKNCARNLQNVVTFYIQMLDKMKHPYENHHVAFHQIIDWLDDTFPEED